MELPSLGDLSTTEAQARIQFNPQDNLDAYPEHYAWPFFSILERALMLPPSVREKSSSAHITGDRDTFFNVTNWDEANDGYSDWAVLKDTEAMAKMMHGMTSQFLYGYDGPKYKPEEQVQRMFAAPLVRKFKEYSQTDKFKDTGMLSATCFWRIENAIVGEL